MPIKRRIMAVQNSPKLVWSYETISYDPKIRFRFFYEYLKQKMTENLKIEAQNIP